VLVLEDEPANNYQGGISTRRKPIALTYPIDDEHEDEILAKKQQSRTEIPEEAGS
jgi:hypothetical protein